MHAKKNAGDTGVVQGSEISQFYDPMICKLCTYDETRQAALDKLELALDNYMIQGVGHNIPFLRDVARNQRFKDGRLTTNFIPEEYPKGFTKVTLTDDEKLRLAAVAAEAHVLRMEKVSSSNPSYGLPYDADNEDDFHHLAVIIDGKAFEATVNGNDGKVAVKAPGAKEAVTIEFQDFDWQVDTPLIKTVIDQKPLSVQCHTRLPQGFRLQMCGSINDVLVRTQREQELAVHMLEKKKVDTSKWLQSPMPGTLVDVKVKVGVSVYRVAAVVV